MPGENVNSISVLGRDLLLVDVGGGAETHLAATDDQPTARAALADGRLDPARPGSAATGDDQDGTLLTRRWAPSTLCGRVWAEMAAGEGGTFRRWQEVSLAPTCRSCLRIVDAWFPTTEAPSGIGLIACVVAETVEALGSAYITGVPAEHIEAVRRAARKHLRDEGFRSQTNVVNAVVHVSSDDAYQAIDPELRRGWLDEAMARIDAGTSSDEGRTGLVGEAIDWHTWVVDG
jgi:hypothetical protein